MPVDIKTFSLKNSTIEQLSRKPGPFFLVLLSFVFAASAWSASFYTQRLEDSKAVYVAPSGGERARRTGRHARGDVPALAYIAPHDAVARRVRAHAGRADHQAHETAHAAAVVKDHAAGQRVALKSAALAGKDA